MKLILAVLVATIYLSHVAQAQGPKPGLWTAADKTLYDTKGKEFLIRGINSNNADWDTYNRNFGRNSFAVIGTTGANLVRVVWKSKSGLTSEDMNNIIYEAKKHKLIVMLELHDFTGGSKPNELIEAVEWWKKQMPLLKKYQDYVIINLVNEWSPWGTSEDTWLNAYKNAIQKFRQETGWNHALVIDSSAYAQNPKTIINKGKELLESDPAKNLIFSLHMYAEWKTPGGHDVGSNLWDIQQQGLTVIIGEFTLHHPEGCKWIKIDAQNIMNEALWKNVGWIAWSWHGNGKGDCDYDLDQPDKSLNMVKGKADQGYTWTQTDYTEFGDLVVNKPAGLKATGKPASIFGAAKPPVRRSTAKPTSKAPARAAAPKKSLNNLT